VKRPQNCQVCAENKVDSLLQRLGEKRVMKKVIDTKNSEAQSEIIKKNHQTLGKLLIYSTKRPLVGKKAWIKKWI